MNVYLSTIDLYEEFIVFTLCGNAILTRNTAVNYIELNRSAPSL